MRDPAFSSRKRKASDDDGRGCDKGRRATEACRACVDTSRASNHCPGAADEDAHLENSAQPTAGDDEDERKIFELRPVENVPFPLAFPLPSSSSSSSAAMTTRTKRLRAGSVNAAGFRRRTATMFALKRPSGSPATLDTLERVKKRKLSHHYFRSPRQFPFASGAASVQLASARPARPSRLRPDEGAWVEDAAFAWHRHHHHFVGPTMTTLRRAPTRRRSTKKDAASLLESWRKTLDKMRSGMVNGSSSSSADPAVQKQQDEMLRVRRQFAVLPSTLERDDPRMIKEQLLAMLRARSSDSGADSSRKFVKWVMWNSWMSKDEPSSSSSDELVTSESIESNEGECEVEEGTDIRVIEDESAAVEPVRLSVPHVVVETTLPGNSISSTSHVVMSAVAAAVASSQHELSSNQQHKPSQQHQHHHQQQSQGRSSQQQQQERYHRHHSQYSSQGQRGEGRAEEQREEQQQHRIPVAQPISCRA